MFYYYYQVLSTVLDFYDNGCNAALSIRFKKRKRMKRNDYVSVLKMSSKPWENWCCFNQSMGHFGPDRFLVKSNK